MSSEPMSIELVPLEASLREELPRCVLNDPECEKTVRDALKGKDGFALDLAVGPELPWMRAVGIVTVIWQILVFVLVFLTARCSDAGSASYPIWIFGLFGLIGAIRIAIEVQRTKTFLVVYTWTALKANVKPFKVIGIATRFHVWFSIYLAFSVINYSDISTDSAFTASTMASLQCPDEKLSSVWSQTLQQSVFAHLHLPYPSLKVLVLVIWVPSFLQTVWPLLRYAGSPLENANRSAVEQIDLLWSKIAMGESNTYKSVVYVALAEASGMATVQTLAVEQCVANVENGRMPDFIIKGLASQMASRVLLSYVAENCLQLNLQISLFAINSYLSKKQFTRAQIQALVSISLGIVTTVAKLTELVSFFKLMKHDKVSTFLDKDGDTEAMDSKRSIKLIYVGSVILVLSLVYAMVKLIAAFACPDSLFNLTGCASL